MRYHDEHGVGKARVSDGDPRRSSSPSHRLGITRRARRTSLLLIFPVSVVAPRQGALEVTAQRGIQHSRQERAQLLW
jgi:hypothetical protein